MKHYFDPAPPLPHEISSFRYEVKGIQLSFTTDAGVFSRHRVDFGSDLLIRALPSLAGSILDLGCGYGPIGISLAALNPGARVVMADINQRAVALAQENIRANKLDNALALASDGFAQITGSFAAIICNPPIRAGKKVFYPLLEQSRQYLEGGGSLWLVIQKKQGASSARAKLEEIYGNCLVIEKSRGYQVLMSNGDGSPAS
jgi:16S rRNA (guanine1207-N2)-methyltransferase